MGWSLRSGGWPFSLWQHDQPVPVDAPMCAAAKFLSHDPPVFFVRLAQDVPANWRDHEVSELQACDIVRFCPKVEARNTVVDGLRLQGLCALNLEVQPSQIKLSVERRISLSATITPPPVTLPTSKQNRSTNTSRLSM